MFGFFNKKIFDKGFLPDCEGHQIYYQQLGNPNGEVVLSFHGGPGGRSKTSHAEYYNLKKQRVIFFDQRGSGRSVAKDITELNDTKRLIKDAKRLLEYLNIEGQISVGGGSWGSTIALLFAIKYPQLVKNIYLNSIFLARHEDMEWMLRDSGLFYPDLLEEIRNQSEGENPYTHYAKLVFSNDLGSIQKAIKYMVHYEYQMGKTNPKFEEVRIDHNANSLIIDQYIVPYYGSYRSDDFLIMKDNEVVCSLELHGYYNNSLTKIYK